MATINPFLQYTDVINSVKMEINGEDMLYVSVLNYGYLMYIMNMLKSLSKWGIDKKILLVCLDKESFNFLSRKGYKTICLDTKITEFSKFDSGKRYLTICFFKWFAISQLLDTGANILFTDGDIVYLKNPLSEIKKLNGMIDIWIQNDTRSENSMNNLCTGFFYVKSNESTRQQFQVASDDQKRLFFNGSGDQLYFNMYMKPNLLCSVLPLNEYPNGAYFYMTHQLQPSTILVHFNWVIGHEKLAKMKQVGLWILTEDEEIACQE